MNLCDINVWLALTLSRHSHHKISHDWLKTVDTPASIIFCRATQQALLRLLTNSTVLKPYGNAPLTNRQAWEVYDALLRDDRIVYRADEPRGLDTRWKQFTSRDSASTRLWMDAYLAAFAVAGSCRLVTHDSGFRQFAGLDVLVLGMP